MKNGDGDSINFAALFGNETEDVRKGWVGLVRISFSDKFKYFHVRYIYIYIIAS